MDQELKKRIEKLENDLKEFKNKYAVHQHNNTDGTNILRKNIMLDKDQWISIGEAQHIIDRRIAGATNDQYQYFVSVGADTQTTGFTHKSQNMQLNFLHYPNNASLQSFLTCFRKPLVSSVENSSVSTTAAGNTVTITGFDFATDELVGALIDIFNSSGTLIETQTISSNNATVVTISGTWLASTSNAGFLIYVPVFLGSADQIWQRFYTQEGTGGGIRFGIGATAGGQNGLLYMDATGDLYWRDKGGTAVKLN